MRMRAFFAVLVCLFLIIAACPVAYSAPASDYGDDFVSLPLKVQEAVKSSQGRVRVGLLTWAGPEMRFGNGLVIEGNYVLVPSALIPFYPELAYGKTTRYVFNGTPASFVYGSLQIGLAVLELSTPLPGAKDTGFAGSIEVGKKYDGVTLLFQDGKSLNVSLVPDSPSSGMLLPEELPGSVIGTALWNESGEVVGIIAATPEGTAALVLSDVIRQFLERFKEWLASRPEEKKIRIAPEDQRVIREKAAAFAEMLELYAVKSLVRPDNISNCAEEMLQMKANEKSCQDRYSVRHPKEEYEGDVVPEGEGRFGGVGLEVSQQDGKVVVVSPIDGTPAFRAAVKSGDVIIKIDGTAVSGITDAVRRMRGKPGTAVEITVERAGREMVFKIVREVITVHAVSARVFEGPSEKIGYLKVKKFSEILPSDFKKEMRAFRMSGIRKVVLDFRYNPGGLLNEALEILYGFARPGDVLIVMRERYRSTVYDTAYVKKLFRLNYEPGEFRDMKVVVLVNKGSASASEVFAGTMKDWGYPIVGPPCQRESDDKACTSTFGKGVGQTVFPLSDGSVLRLTTFEFLVGNSKTKINDIGVVPTHYIASPQASSAEILREDRQLEKAIEILLK
ncbi:MAG: S41 family peptidase [Candidatus Sungbacteria bacterium]|nr:S41 family peptidase [Candidatus Sungbacteria bacterium]